MNDLGTLTGLIVAASGVLGILLAHRLGLLGQKRDVEQQQAANKIAERIAAFDELESLNDRLTTENARLREENREWRSLEAEADARGDVRLAQQARRCRERLDSTVAALATLQAVVVSEVARSSAQNAIDVAELHLSTEHPADETPDLQ